MAQTTSLTEGNIASSLARLALPIMGTSFIQMAYNMIDMIWIGRLGSKSVAAVGTAGFFTWLAMAFILIPRIGAEIGVAQSVGREDWKRAREYVGHALQLVVFFALVYSAGLVLFKDQLIAFFQLGDQLVIEQAGEYLVIIALGLIFYFLNPVFTGIFNGQGNSQTPFRMNAVGLIANIVLDPLLIFGVGPFPAMGVRGAAIATVLAQMAVTLLFLISMGKDKRFFQGIGFFRCPNWGFMRRIITLGLPVALQSGLFTIFAMFIARIIAVWGPTAIAVQKVGSQIESISWMTTEGFSSALGAFVGQNYGAGKADRIHRGYYVGLGIVGGIGLFATGLLIFGAETIFRFFIPEPEAVALGIDYLRILGVSQFFMCIEIGTRGAFNGLGKTLPPSLVGIVFTGLRIPLARVLSGILGLNGVWWTISLTSICKGLLLTGWFMTAYQRKLGKGELAGLPEEKYMPES